MIQDLVLCLGDRTGNKIDCFLEPHETRFGPLKMQQPEVERQSSESQSKPRMNIDQDAQAVGLNHAEMCL